MCEATLFSVLAQRMTQTQHRAHHVSTCFEESSAKKLPNASGSATEAACAQQTGVNGQAQTYVMQHQCLSAHDWPCTELKDSCSCIMITGKRTRDTAESNRLGCHPGISVRAFSLKDMLLFACTACAL